MAKLDIITYPHPGLKRKADPVKQVDDRIRNILDDMLETMYAAPGIGLAANQVDFYERVITIDVSEHKDSPLFLINPEILSTSGTEEMEEGCLSIPNIYEKVTRPSEVSIKALDRDGNEFRLDAEGLLAVCIQHEIDHINGILFIDHLSMLKRQRIHRKLIKEKRRAAAEAEI